MKTQTTPGPWIAEHDSFGPALVAFPHKMRHVIARLDTGEMTGESAAEANNRLISAAPELLAALNNLTKEIDAMCFDSDIPAICKAAVMAKLRSYERAVEVLAKLEDNAP